MLPLPPAYVISGDPARLAQFREAWRAVGLPDAVRDWGACMIPADGTLGCAVAHYALVRHALAAGLPALLVFEDDALPRDDAAELLAPEIDAARERGDAGVLLGWIPTACDEALPRDARRVLGSHAYALLSRAAMLDYCDAWTRMGKPDATWHEMRGRVSLSSRNLFAQHVPACATRSGIHCSRGWNMDRRVQRVREDYARGFARALATRDPATPAATAAPVRVVDFPAPTT